MDVRKILAELRRERDRVEAAIAAIESLNSGRRFGRRVATAGPAKRHGRRRMSAAARKRIGEAKKRWWAERKKRAA